MADEVKRSKVELIKEGSRQLRGTIAEELLSDLPEFCGDSEQLLKLHGIYQQDDRDHRKDKTPDGKPKGKQFMFMVRTRIPGGRVSARQFLDHLDLCEKYANGTLRVTDRQGFQLHGVIKSDLKNAVRGINQTLLTSMAACGDVERNVMCCPAPCRGNLVHDQMQAMADAIAEHLRPRTTAYHEIWLTDSEGNKTNATEYQPVDEPIYGKVYLPRKFKTGIALPSDNCVDIYTHDLGFLAIVENDRIQGYNVLVGGGMGTTPSAEKTFPAMAQPMTYVKPDQVLAVAEAVVKVQRDFGNREDRKIARLKYLIHNWGLPKFKAKVEEYFGQPLPEPKPIAVTGVEHHMGWHDQRDGKLWLGINIDTGRIKDTAEVKMKSGLRKILETYGMETRLTAMQSVLLCDISPSQRPGIEQILRDHGISTGDDQSLLRKLSIACPAFPTCGLAVTESERVYDQVISLLEGEFAKCGLANEPVAMHMTGCPNGCARPYTPDIGLVGKTLGKYTIFLGGNTLGTRLGFIYDDLVPLEDLPKKLSPVIRSFSEQRTTGESFGDYCNRIGLEELKKLPVA